MAETVTCVIPTYNEREDLLRRALDSLRSQTYDHLEVIVVDDGSTDRTPDILREYAGIDWGRKTFRTIRRERTGPLRSVSEAFNLGIEAAAGDWWHHDAADCWHEPDWAEACVEHLAGREDAGGVHTDHVIHEYGGKERHVEVGLVYNPDWSTFQNYARHEALGGMLFRMEIVKRLRFDVRFPRKQTREFTLRYLHEAPDLAYLPRELWHFDQHEPDQWKKLASIKWRVLGDLKNGWDPRGNLLWAINSGGGMMFAAFEAFREFYQDEAWKWEREHSPLAKETRRAAEACLQEASEPWSEPNIAIVS